MQTPTKVIQVELGCIRIKEYRKQIEHIVFRILRQAVITLACCVISILNDLTLHEGVNLQ